MVGTCRAFVLSGSGSRMSRKLFLAFGVLVVMVVSACSSPADTGSPKPNSAASSQATAQPSPPVDAQDNAALQMEPADGLMNGSVVDVQGTGLRPNSRVILVQCISSYPAGKRLVDACNLPSAVTVKVGSEGTYTAKLVVRTFIDTGKRVETTCLPNGCLVAVADAISEEVVTTAELNWADQAVVPPSPTLKLVSLVPAEGRTAGQAVVKGFGFPPNETISLTQCPVSSKEVEVGVDAGDCIYDYGTNVESSRTGEITAPMRLYQKFQRSSGEIVDCGKSMSVCVVAHVYPRDPSVRMSVMPFDYRSIP